MLRPAIASTFPALNAKPSTVGRTLDSRNVLTRGQLECLGCSALGGGNPFFLCFLACLTIASKEERIADLERQLEGTTQARYRHRDAAIVLLMFRHGLRVSELCDLRKVDLDLKSSRIWVARKKGSLSTEQPIEGDTLRFVKRYLKERADHLPWLIVTERGTQFTRFGINYLVKRAGVDAGLPVHGGIHDRQEANDTRSPLELLIHSIDDVLDVVDMAYPAECLDRNPVTFKLHYPFDAQTDREHDIRLLKRQVKALKAILREINAWDDTVLSRGVRCGTRSVFGPCYS